MITHLALVTAVAPANRLQGTGKPTVWSEFGQIAASHAKATNLGQGFPDWQPPDFVLREAHKAIDEGFNQYTRPAGHPPLAHVLAERYSRHLHRDVNPDTQVAVTVGASQALYLTLQAMLNPGEEVLLLEPAFDLYYGQVRLAGGTSVPVALSLSPATDEVPAEWHLDAAAVEAAITPRTKILLLNSPHNPTGKVFTHAEMVALADIVRRHPQLLVISDEVYKYIIHSPVPGGGGGGEAVAGGSGDGTAAGVGSPRAHAHFAALPDMFERTVTVSSAGKTFSITGWQTGWCVGPEHLIRPIQLLLPFVQFCAATPMQQALSRVLTLADQPYEGHASYYEWLCAMYRRKREVLVGAIGRAGLQPVAGQGGFFLMADTSALEVPDEFLKASTPAAPVMTRDWALCRWLALEAGVVAIPASPFFSLENRHLGANHIRLAFCKSDATLIEAGERLERFVESRRS